MKIKFGENDEIETDRLREFGGMLLPNCDDPIFGRAYITDALPRLIEGAREKLPADSKLLHSEVVVGNPEHTPGPHPPYGWYVIFEVPA